MSRAKEDADRAAHRGMRVLCDAVARERWVLNELRKANPQWSIPEYGIVLSYPELVNVARDYEEAYPKAQQEAAS